MLGPDAEARMVVALELATPMLPTASRELAAPTLAKMKALLLRTHLL
jgi:hypothetical protein